MAEKAAKSEDAGPNVVDLQNDVRWQERLAEARERRAQALKEMGRESGASRQPRKPWEEATPAILPSAARPKPEIEKDFDFLDRMNVLKRVTGRDKKAELDPTDREPRPGQNWYPGADDGFEHAPPVDAPPKNAPDQTPAESDEIVPPKLRAQRSVDAVFNEPIFEQDVPEAPVSLLLQITEPAPPSSTLRPWLERQDDVIVDEVSVPNEAPIEAFDDKASSAKKWILPGWVSIAALVLVAIAAGPLSVYAPWQQKAIGPASPVFGLQPAFGLTAPLVGFPQTISATDWRPASIVPPNGPLGMKQALPPKFVRVIAPFDILPQFGSPEAGANLPTPAVPIPDVPRTAPTAPRLTLTMFERIWGDPASLVALPPVLAGVSLDSIKPVRRPKMVPLTQ
jgi:hypothetical protein